MRRLVRRLNLLLALWLIAFAVHAGVHLTVQGVDEPLRSAVVSAVELSQYATREVSRAQLRRLIEHAPAQVTSALEPYGYFDATVHADLQPAGKNWQVTLQVTPGQPVKITAVELQLADSALAIAPIRRARRALERLRGQTLNDSAYEAARDALSGQLTANGFLDARLTTHRVEVHRAARSAVIKLAWKIGPRYRYGQVRFDGSQFAPGFLDRYLPFKPGDYFAQDQLLALQQALSGADYFAVVNVMPEVTTASNGVIDISVHLAPAKRTVYTGGPFIGTDTGFGLRAGVERRWVNRRGHTWKNELVLAQRLKTLSTLYAIPLPGRDQRSLNFGANLRDANTTTSQSRTLELVGNENRQWHGWIRTVGAHVLSGTFTVGKRGNEPDNAPGIEHGRSTLVFAEAALSRKQQDNPNFVHRGWSINLDARSTAGTLLSDASFSQLTADAKWIRAFGARQRNRLILRGSVGTTWTSNFTALPPQLRFFAGGDRSVRGYGYQAIGPRNDAGRVIGGPNLLVASTEVEHYFSPHWGMAAFVDAGNAFSGTDYRPKIGTGLGVRWLSPVGMIRLDVGTPINDAHVHGIELHLVVGPDL
jgi:translocation and assembly module TamA